MRLNRRLSAFLSTLAIFLTATVTLLAQSVANETSSSLSIRSKTSIFMAGTKEYSFDQIRNDKSLAFVPLTNFEENIGFSNENYWLKFDIENSSAGYVEYYIETARPITDVVNLYLVDQNGQVKQQLSGDKIPFEQKSVKHRKSIFDVPLEPYQKVSGYIHIQSDGEVVMFPLNVYKKDQFFNLTYKEQVFYGFFYGILILACIIYLFFFFALKDKAFVYYGLYVLFIALMQFSLDGFFHQYLTPQGGWISDKAVLLTAFISLFFFCNYGDTFLNLKENSPFLHRSSKFLSISILGGLGIMVFIPGLFAYCYPLANAIGILVLANMITSLVVMKWKKVTIDPYFIIGISFLVGGFVIFILNNFNTIENSFFTNNGAKFGIGLEIVFLSISMSNRIRDLRMENEKNQLLALQRAEDMNEIKSSFLSNISHELRTPLNLIMGVATALQQNNEEADLQEKCRMILSSSKNLLGNIEDILDFTVIEKGDQELKEVSFDLQNTLMKVITVQKRKAEAKNLDFMVSIAEDLPNRIVGDKGKLVQILNHLLDNAIKFTNEGSVQMEVRCKKNGDGRIALYFKIVDTGIGISKEKMSTVFESFTKKSFTDKREYSGLGLGLFIVKNYVDLQGGTIYIKNNESIGTVCELNLSFEVDEDALVLENEVPEEQSGIGLQGTHILLVEDNKMNQTVIKLLFKKWQNVNLSIANHGKEALELMQSNTFDLVLMDLQMPEMDGFETTALIREGKANCDAQIPILVLTADNTSATRKEIFRLGANDLVTKPVNGQLVYSKMVKYISAKNRVA